MSEPKGTAVGEQDLVAARLMLLMKVRRRSPAAAMQPLQRRLRAYRARYRQHYQAGDAHRVGRVERVQHVGERDRIRRDLQVVGEVERALVLQRDVGDAGAGQEGRGIGVTTSSYLASMTV